MGSLKAKPVRVRRCPATVNLIVCPVRKTGYFFTRKLCDMNLENLISTIGHLDESAMEAARARQDRLTKPQGSLGRLEEVSIRGAGITGQPLPILEKKAILVMAGDHGVVEEGVSAYPQEVTRQMVFNFLAGGAA